MKTILTLFICLLITLNLPAQNFTGQWKGQFIDKSTLFAGLGGDSCEYVLELDCKGTDVSGYSYTYFNDGGKRYYTICKLTGTLNKASKYIEVTEIERTKTNVPKNIRNCFQIHRLTYFKNGQEQTLQGNWIPAPNQDGNCGFGSTTLSRRLLQKNSYAINKLKPADTIKNNSTKIPKQNIKSSTTVASKNPIAKNNPTTTIKKSADKVVTKPTATVKNNSTKSPSVKVPKQNIKPTTPVIRNNPVFDDNLKSTNNPVNEKNELQPKLNTDIIYEKRTNTLLKTIEIENRFFVVNLYDDGEIDGDSISLFFNGKLLLQHQRLTDKPITLTLKADEKKDINELIMYAENLGLYPPNTALMIVNDGEKRYEVRISSDLEQSGAIRFIYKPKTRQ